MPEQPVITTNVRDIADFIQEAKEHNIKRVYRDTVDRGKESMHYTAWDPERKTLISAQLTFPEIVELNAMHPGERYSNGFEYVNDKAATTPSSKQKFATILRKLGVSKDITAEFRSVKVDKINKLIDDSALEEHGDAIFTSHESGGFYERELECNALGGLVKRVSIFIERRHHDLSYHIIIKNWNSIFQALCNKHETAFEAAKLQVVPGLVEVK